MKFVEIYRLGDDGKQTVVAKCVKTDETVKIEGEPFFAYKLQSEGITDYSDPEKKTIMPDAGEKFLEQLKFNYKSGYLNASDIKES